MERNFLLRICRPVCTVTYYKISATLLMKSLNIADVRRVFNYVTVRQRSIMLRNVWDVFEPPLFRYSFAIRVLLHPFLVKHVTITAKIRLSKEKTFLI